MLEHPDAVQTLKDIDSADHNPTITIGTPNALSQYGVSTCTRFQLDGENIVIRKLTFSQTKCHLSLSTADLTPIVFSGASAIGAQIIDVTIIDSPTAVAVLGGDGFVYRYTPFTNATDLYISGVTFEYTSAADEGVSLPLVERHNLAALGRTVGNRINIHGSVCSRPSGTDWLQPTVIEPCILFPTHVTESTTSIPNVCTADNACQEAYNDPDNLNLARTILPCCSERAPEPDSACTLGARCVATNALSRRDKTPRCDVRFCEQPESTAFDASTGQHLNSTCTVDACVVYCVGDTSPSPPVLGYTHSDGTDPLFVAQQWYATQDGVYAGLFRLMIDGTDTIVQSDGVLGNTHAITPHLIPTASDGAQLALAVQVNPADRSIPPYLLCAASDFNLSDTRPQVNVSASVTMRNCTDPTVLLVDLVPVPFVDSTESVETSERVQLRGRPDLCLTVVENMTHPLQIAQCGVCAMGQQKGEASDTLVVPSFASHPPPDPCGVYIKSGAEFVTLRSFLLGDSTTSVAITEPPSNAPPTQHTVSWGLSTSGASITINQGDTVVWQWNQNDVRHDVVSGTPGYPTEMFRSPQQSSGSYSHTFSSSGVFPYYCTLHPSMTATISVLSSAPSSLASSTSNVPAGTALFTFGRDGSLALQLAPGGEGCIYENNTIGPCTVRDAFNTMISYVLDPTDDSYRRHVLSLFDAATYHIFQSRGAPLLKVTATQHPPGGIYHAYGLSGGSGAKISVSGVDMVVLTPGGGYFNGDQLLLADINFNPIETRITALCQQVVIQPYGTPSTDNSIEIDVTGASLINVSSFTSIFGAPYEESAFPAPARTTALYTLGNLVLLVLNISLICAHIFMIFLTEKLQNEILNADKPAG